MTATPKENKESTLREPGFAQVTASRRLKAAEFPLKPPEACKRLINKDLRESSKIYFTFYIVQGRFLTVRRSERVGEWSNPWSFFPRSLRGGALSDLHFSPVAAVRWEIQSLPSKRPSPGSTHFRRGLTPFPARILVKPPRQRVDILISRYDFRLSFALKGAIS